MDSSSVLSLSRPLLPSPLHAATRTNFTFTRRPTIVASLCSLSTGNGHAVSASLPTTTTTTRTRTRTNTTWSRTRVFLSKPLASMGTEETYIMVKPDGVQRGLVGEIISRFEKKGFLLKGLKLFQCPKDLAQEHYKDLKEKSFYPSLIDYITSGPVVCMAWEGAGVVASARKLIGATNPLQAEPGTIRGDLAVQTGRNVVHGSDSPENGKREIALWFKEGELCEWVPAQAPWLIE
ncbi:uncharacterized protein LOC144569325 [Carex rostrata]